MMYKSFFIKLLRLYGSMILVFAVLCYAGSIKGYAYENPSRYILVYKNLYEYGKCDSKILSLYRQLKAQGKDTLICKWDMIDILKVSPKDIIIIIPDSFYSESEYKPIIDSFHYNKVIIYGKQSIYDEESVERKGLLLGIDKIYPFSDLNRLMDTADMLYQKGIDPVFIIMPVYDNYELEAYDKFIEVLKYIGKKGGHFFIHEPIINKDSVYNMDPRPGFIRAVEEYRKRGVDLVGVKLSLDRLLSNNSLFQGLNLPLLIVTEQEEKVDTSLDLYKISGAIDRHAIISGCTIDLFNIFSYKAKKNYSSDELITLDINNDVEKLEYFLNLMHSEKIPIRDFNIKDFSFKLQESSDIPDGNVITEEGSKTQLDKFMEQELEKIKGSNLEQEEQGAEGYDISPIVAIGLRVGLILASPLLIYIFIGRRLDIKKFFRS